jgi:hypothetical protein
MLSTVAAFIGKGREMRWVSLIAALALAGCATSQGNAPTEQPSAPTSAAASPAAASAAPTNVPNPDPLPKNYRALIVEYVKQHYVDPTSIREASIAEPFYGSPRLNLYGGPLGYVCVRANAKTRTDIYSGLKTTAYLFHNGKIVDTHRDKMGLIICRAPAPYQPFPELEAIKKGPPA